MFAHVSLYREKINQCAYVFFLRRRYTFVYGFVVELSARYAQRLVGYQFQNVSLKPSETLEKRLRTAFRASSLLQIRRDVLAVRQYAVLTHAFHHRHHLFLAHPQYVCQIIHARLRLRLLCLRDVFARYERLYHSHRSLRLVTAEQRRLGYAPSRLVHVLHRDARGIYMRHIVASFYISALFKRRQSRTHTGLYVRHRVVPSRLTRYLQCRAAHAHVLPRHIFHCLPHLLYLAYAQLCLIQQDEMLVKVVVAIKHVAARAELRVSAGASGFLHIVLQRVGYVVMHHESHILLVNTHTERRCSHNHAHLVFHKSVLIGGLRLRVHLTVERQRPVSVARQSGCNVPCASCPRHIHYRRTAALRHQFPEHGVFLFVGLRVYYGIAQVRTRCRGGEQFHIQTERIPEVVAYVLHHLLLRRSRETRHRNRLLQPFLLLILTYELAYIQIVYSEILSP